MGDDSTSDGFAGRACYDHSAMPSPVYNLFESAMRARRQIVCTYNGRVRVLCPIILGHSKGQEKALTFQVGGESNSALSAEGEWRCLFLDKVSNARTQEGPWRSGESHAQPQGCVEDVDLDVNTASPYRPKRCV